MLAFPGAGSFCRFQSSVRCMHADACLFLLDSIFEICPAFCTASLHPRIHVLDRTLCHVHLSCTLVLLLVLQATLCTALPGVHGRKVAANRRQERPCTRARVWKAARSSAQSSVRGRTAPCALWFPPLCPLRAVSRCHRGVPALRRKQAFTRECARALTRAAGKW